MCTVDFLALVWNTNFDENLSTTVERETLKFGYYSSGVKTVEVMTLLVDWLVSIYSWVHQELMAFTSKEGLGGMCTVSKSVRDHKETNNCMCYVNIVSFASIYSHSSRLLCTCTYKTNVSSGWGGFFFSLNCKVLQKFKILKTSVLKTKKMYKDFSMHYKY